MNEERVRVDGRPARYVATGKGPPLVLVHGLGGSWRWWAPLFDALGSRRRLYVVDCPTVGRPVHGYELSEWLEHWLDAAGLERVDLAGHSLGGLMAAELAARRPERIERLVLVAPAGVPCGRTVGGRVVPLVESLYQVRRSLPTVAADAVRAGPLGLLRGAVFVSNRDLRAELRAITAPTLVNGVRLADGDHEPAVRQ